MKGTPSSNTTATCLDFLPAAVAMQGRLDQAGQVTNVVDLEARAAVEDGEESRAVVVATEEESHQLHNLGAPIRAALPNSETEPGAVSATWCERQHGDSAVAGRARAGR